MWQALLFIHLFISPSQQLHRWETERLRNLSRVAQLVTSKSEFKSRLQNPWLTKHFIDFLKLCSSCSTSWIRCFICFHTTVIKNCLHITSFNLQCCFMILNFQVWKLILIITCKLFLIPLAFLSLCVSELEALSWFFSFFPIFLQKTSLVLGH